MLTNTMGKINDWIMSDEENAMLLKHRAIQKMIIAVKIATPFRRISSEITN